MSADHDTVEQLLRAAELNRQLAQTHIQKAREYQFAAKELKTIVEEIIRSEETSE